MNYRMKRLRVLQYLLRKCHKVENCWIIVVSKKTIANRLKISTSSAYRALNFLQRRKIIKKYRAGWRNLYKINI